MQVDAAVPEGLDQVAMIAARSGNHHGAAIGRDCALAMQPDIFAFGRVSLDAIVTHVEHAVRRTAEGREHALSDQGAIHPRPTHGPVVTAEIHTTFVTRGGQRLRAAPVGVPAQNALPEPARSTVHEHRHGLHVHTQRLDARLVDDLGDPEQLGETSGYRAVGQIHRKLIYGHGHGCRSCSAPVDVRPNYASPPGHAMRSNSARRRAPRLGLVCAIHAMRPSRCARKSRWPARFCEAAPRRAALCSVARSAS
jgi:hypothetical protein